MQITVSARHGEIANDVQRKIESKAAKLPKFFERVTEIVVTLDLEKSTDIKAEVRVSAEHHDDFVSTDCGGNVLTASDGAFHKMETQLRKHKEKLTGHKQTSVKHVEVADSTSDASDAGDVNDDEA